MKKALMLVAVAAMMVFSFNSCVDPEETTKTDLLTQSKGWVLSSATSTPGYAMADGSFAGDLIKDGYLEDFELDDILYFNANGGMTIDPGALLGTEFGYKAEVASAWEFTENETKIKMQLPMFYDWDNNPNTFDPIQEECKILALNENEFRVNYTFKDDDSPAKGQYSFILTYVPAK